MTVSERSYAPLSADHFARLAGIVSIAHADLREIRPDLSGQLAAACLAQGAAGHVLDHLVGVKDLDLWLFYVGTPRADELPRGVARPTTSACLPLAGILPTRATKADGLTSCAGPLRLPRAPKGRKRFWPG